MFAPPFDNWLSITIPLVPPRVLGDVTQLEVGAPVQIGVVSDVVTVELSRNPSVEPTPKNIRSVVPSKNSVSGEHSSPFVLFTTKFDEPVLVMMWAANGKKNVFGFEGFSGLDVVPDTNPHPIMWPDVDPFSPMVDDVHDNGIVSSDRGTAVHIVLQRS
jgi:hypothetical protein